MAFSQSLKTISGFSVGVSLTLVSGLGPVAALPSLDLSAYPKPAPGLQRWVIQPSGLLPKSRDPLVSSHPLDWRIQLIVGQEVTLDCNVRNLSGPGMTMRMLPEASGKALFEVRGPLRVISTKKACPPGEPLKRSFLSLGQQPYLVPYNLSWPIVVDLPKGAELRWRLWKAEKRQKTAAKL